MKKIILATRNAHKLEEFEKMFADYQILSLDDIGFVGDIDETGTTLEENSKIKAETIFEFYKSSGEDFAVIADDSGLCVDALGGRPGIYSARYAGDHNDESNRVKLLKELEGETNRDAYMACALCYKDKNVEKVFLGKTMGKITTEKLGSDKFGYDSVFYSNKLGKTFGQATMAEKDSVSHRGVAVSMLKEFLNEQK